MTRTSMLLGLALFALACAPGSDSSIDPTDTDPDIDDETDEPEEPEHELDPAASFVLLELFTSQGCYSCPPAEANLNGVIADQLESGERIFSIAWHVDYWDYIGWPDPYGDAAHNDRQYAYGAHFDLTYVYTPQMVANAESEFVGSSASQTQQAIAQGMAHAIDVGVTLWPEAEPEEGEVTVEYDVIDAPDGTTLHIVLTERGLVDSVTSGENAGKTLENDGVARAWVQVEPGVGNVTLAFPEDVDLDKSTLIGFVQDDSDYTLYGGTSAPLR